MAGGGAIRGGAGALRQFLNASINKAIRRSGPDSGAPERIERILTELPHTAEVFSPSSIADAALGASPNQIIGLKPSEFRQLAAQIPIEEMRPFLDHYKQLLQTREFTPQPELFNDWYNKTRSEQPFEGFDSIPFLQYRASWPDNPKLSGRIKGHEGRHRMQSINELFGDDLPWPVQIMGEKEHAFPRSPFIVYPQVEDDMLPYARPMDLTRRPRFARGGAIRCGGLRHCNCDACGG